jgi:hypothetical protein
VNSAPNVQPSPRFPLATLLTLFRQLSGVQVVLDTDPQPVLGQSPSVERAWIQVSVTSYRAIGVDEVRVQYAPAPVDANQYKIGGQRQVITNLQARSYDATLQAFDLLERIRVRLHTDTAAAIWQPQRLSLASSGRDLNVHVFKELGEELSGVQRYWLAASMDITWNWVSIAGPPVGDEGPYIAEVDGGGVIPGNLGN